MPCPDPRVARRLSWPLLAVVAPMLFAALPPGHAHATGEVAGPIEIGPAWGTADAGRSTATLFTTLRNHGDLADRLIRVECPASGQVTLQGGAVHSDVMAPNAAQADAGARRYGSQNGLDIPPALDGRSQLIKASFLLSAAIQPLTPGAHVPCSLYFAHDGQRVVMFTLGVQPPVTTEP